MNNENSNIHPADGPGINETNTSSADNNDYAEARDDAGSPGVDYRDYRESTHSVTSKIAYLIGVKKSPSFCTMPMKYSQGLKAMTMLA